MIIIRNKKSGHVENLYYISTTKGLEKELIKPTIPNDFLVRGKFTDWQTPRIKLYTSISDALSGLFLGQELGGTSLYAYRAKHISPESLIGPASITTVPYAMNIEEWWYLSICRFDYLGEIEIGKKEKIETYLYGPHQTKGKLYRWSWNEKLKPWQKKGILK